MRERLEKRLKSVLKKKVKLTLGVLISFLTTGNIGYAKIINEENISSTLIIEENQEIENSGIISGNANVTEADIVFNGSGVIITSTSNLENLIDITNSGIISGNASIVGTNISVNGNGVIITSTSNLENLIDITNSGIISGNASITENASITGNTSIIGTNISGNGNGVVATGNLENLIDITNSGIISGNANVTEDASITGNASIIGTNISGNGNGVVITSNLESLINITNSGIISGNASIIGTDINSNGNGVIITINLESLTNTGVISGGIIYPLLEEGNSIHILDMSGNGIVREYISNNIVNNGIIKGSTSAIAAQSISGAVINNGILAGREIFSNSYEIHMFETTNSILQEINLNTITPTTEINNGIYVKLESETSERNDGNATGNVKVDSSGNPIIEEIEIGTGGKVTLEDGSEKTIINGSTTGEKTISETILNKESDDKMDIYLSSSNLDTTSNVIINGTGIEKGALVVDSETTLTDSIVNGYNTGIYLEQGKFTVINTTINGGGLKNDVAVLKGDENGNIVEILGTSVINGKVELGAGEDSLTIGNSVQINGDLDGGIGEDTLKLGDKELAKTESNLNIYHNINDFENIVFEGDTTLYETSSITGTTNIEIKSGTQVNLRVDSSVQDSDGTYKTHALFNFTSDQLIIKGDKDKITEEDFNEDNNFVVEENESEEGYDKVSILNLVTNGLGREAIIDLGNVKIEDTVWVKTDSIINQATKNETEDGTTITIEAEKDLFSINKEFAEEKYYLELNEIYKGIHSSNDDNFNVLNSIITGTLTDANKGDYTTITDKQQMATLLAYLKQIYTETPYSFSAEASRKSMNVFGDIVKENNFKAKDGEIITYGGLTHNNGEGTDKYYGKNYHGFDIGSADTKVDSKMTGAYGQIEKGISDSTAVGLMLGGNNNKVDIATSDLKGNSAYLGGYVKHDKGAFRGIAGIGIQYSDWDSHRNTMSDSYKENYSDRGLNIYAEGKYTKELTEGLFLEPKVGVSYDYIKQESINESKDKALALEVDGKDFDTLSGNVGLDLRKEIVTEKGKHNLTVGVNYTRILSGADEDNLTGNFGGNSFDILVPQKTKDNVSVGIKYDIELETGVMLGAKVSYDVPFKVSQDNHTHKNEGSWKVGVGIGYRFNTLNDLNPMNIISSSKKDSNITLRTKSYFEFDKAELNNNSKKVIEKFSEKINRDNLKGKIKIEGYTDNVGKSNYNEKLSLERATKVAEELKKQVKNSDTEYEILGKGATNPIGDNETEVGRAKNRRVEIEFQEK
jgi:outer membrane protein OmpA-like peptidoglycan-associated protein